MKKNVINIIAAVSVLFSIIVSLCPTAIAQSSAFDTGRSSIYTLPANASATPTAEQESAWNNLSQTEKDDVLVMMKGIVDDAKKQKSQRNTQPKSTALTFVDEAGVTSDVDTSAKFNNQVDLTYTPVPRSSIYEKPKPGDEDLDGLNDVFENGLADGFTPFYRVSGGEISGTGFATFLNSVPQTVSQVFAANPPRSNFRVTPLGFGTTNGVQYGYIQLDYLTLWNRDDGLSISSACTTLSAGLGLSLAELGSHNLDNERAAILVAAPVTVANTFNTTASAYKAYQFFTAAHEDTFFDQSLVFNPLQPVNFNRHIHLGLSRSKHGTYPFNPNYLPLVPDYVIYSVFATINILYITEQINIYQYLAFLYAANTVFFACAIERFQDQGAVLSGVRTNVGELNSPLNNSIFIQDTELTRKLNKYF